MILFVGFRKHGGRVFTGCCPNQPSQTIMRVMMSFLKCLVGGLRHFKALRNGGPPGPERSRGEQWRGEASPVRNALKRPGWEPRY